VYVIYRFITSGRLKTYWILCIIEKTFLQEAISYLRFVRKLQDRPDCSNGAFDDSIRTEGNMLILLVVILLLMSVGSLPSWGHSRDWGYYPSGGLGLVVLILVVLLLMGRL
jgi:hypothetical protein